MKKILAILLSVTMLLGCVVFSTVASAETTAFEIGAGVNVIPVADENVVKTFGSLATITDCDYGKAWSELRTGDKLEFVIDVETAGTYYFSLAYAWGGKSSFTLAVDGTDAATIVCPTTGGWSAPIAVNDPTAVELAAGAHDITLTLTEPDGGLNSFFAINICDSADAEITYPIWRYAASAMPGAATGVKDAAGQTFAYHANVLQAFDGFYFSMATWNANDAYCKIAIYNWAYNYENTLAGEPIATKEINPMADNTPNGIDFESPLPAGEYLFYIYDTSAAHCGIYYYEGADEKGVTYVDGVADTTWIPALGIKINEGFGEGTEILGVASAETEVPAPVYEVAVDNQGATENHGLTITNNIGGVSVSYQFKTTAAFKAFSMKFGYFSADRNVNVTIYNLDDELIQTWSRDGHEDVPEGNTDGVWETFELDEALPAGEYVIVADPTADTDNTKDVIWKKYDVVDANGIFHSTFDAEDAWAVNATPCLTFTFTEFAEDGVYFVKAGETPDEPEPPVVEDTTAEDTTAEDTTAEDTTAEDTTAADTTAEDTTAADTTVADTTAADTTVADTTAAGTEAGTAAGTAAGTKAPATTTAAAAAEGCKAVVGSMSAIALVAIASAAAVVLKKKED